MTNELIYVQNLRARLRRQRRELRLYRLLLIASAGALCFFLLR